MSNTRITLNYKIQPLFSFKILQLTTSHHNIREQGEMAIGQKYQELGGADGWLGEPTGNSALVPADSGWCRHFQNGSIYWSPETGAQVIHGAIRDE